MFKSIHTNIDKDKKVLVKEELVFCIYENRVISKRNTSAILQEFKKDKSITSQLSLSELQLFVSKTNLNPEEKARLIKDIIEKIDKLYALRSLNIDILTTLNPKFPKRLKSLLEEDCPNILYYKGNLNVLRRKTIAIVGSRKASAESMKKAFEIAKVLSNSGYNIISGYANGIDLAAHQGALTGRGFTTLILSEGILKFNDRKLKSGLDHSIDNLTPRTLIISEFPMNLPWYSYNAMKRNSTIASLAEKVFIIEADIKGGSTAMGNYCIEKNKPLYVASKRFDKLPDGNKYFLDNGGKPLERYLKYLMKRGTIELPQFMNDQKTITSFIR